MDKGNTYFTKEDSGILAGSVLFGNEGGGSKENGKDLMKVVPNSGFKSKRLYKEDLENIVRGACLLSSGGGGTYSSGTNLLECFSINDYYKQDYVDYVEVDELPDSSEDVGLAVAYMGAPEAIANLKYPEAAVNAVNKMNEFIESKGEKLAYIVPVEIGALSSIVACTVAAKLGISVINGDGAGRAVPELMMTTFAGYDISTNPTVLATEDNTTIQLQVDKPGDKDASIVEEVARPTISLKKFGQSAGLAMWVMPTSKIKEVVKITNTLVACREIGKLITEYQAGTQINIQDLLQLINSKLNTDAFELCSGTLCSIESSTEGGFDHGNVMINCEGNDEGKKFTVLFQNENLLVWDPRSATPLAMAPDAIAYVVYDEQVVYSNGDLKEKIEGNNSIKDIKVSVIGIAAHPELRRCEADKSNKRAKRLQATDYKKEGEIIHSFELALEKFGYYGAYVPIEELQTGK